MSLVATLDVPFSKIDAPGSGPASSVTIPLSGRFWAFAAKPKNSKINKKFR